MHNFKGSDADEEDLNRDDTILSEVFIRFEDNVSLYLYADLFPIWNRGSPKYGAVKGTALTVWRILRCNPFAKGGYDPVP